jgi:hypothetical protein
MNYQIKLGKFTKYYPYVQISVVYTLRQKHDNNDSKFKHIEKGRINMSLASFDDIKTICFELCEKKEEKGTIERSNSTHTKQ